MTRVVRLEPHDPLPTGRGDYITVVRRFKDDAPDGLVTEITVYTRGAGAQNVVAEEHGGHALGFEQALERARVLAERNRIPELFVVDRTTGEVERTVLEHHGERDLADVGPDYDEAAHAGAEEGGIAGTRPEDARQTAPAWRR
ncbi:MAG TPA: hypothetical protein VNI78_08800 [Vicinamibacterales bacterium]|nr:hypothetical protein [Vicinamibacterales bacterium]